MAKIKNLMIPKAKSTVDDIVGEPEENQPKVQLKQMLSRKRARKPRKM